MPIGIMRPLQNHYQYLSTKGSQGNVVHNSWGIQPILCFNAILVLTSGISSDQFYLGLILGRGSRRKVFRIRAQFYLTQINIISFMKA